MSEAPLHDQLEAAFARIRAYITASIDGTPVQVRTPHEYPSSIDDLRHRFALSDFECDVLLLACAIELNGEFAELCERANGGGRGYPTFGLALATFPDADWRSTLPTSPLRFWHLIEMTKTRTLAEAPIAVDETILNAVVGLRHLDARLFSATLAMTSGPLSPSQRRYSTDVSAALDAQRVHRVTVQLCGPDAAAKRAIANEACAALQLTLVAIDAASLVTEAPGSLVERLWQREAILGLGALFIDAERIDPSEAGQWAAIARFIDRIDIPVMLSTAVQRQLGIRPTVAVVVPRPTRAEQRALWRQAMQSSSLAGLADELAYQFDFNLEQIEMVWRTSVARLAEVQGDEAASVEAIGDTVWGTAREYARVNLDELAHRIVPRASWDDLILGSETKSLLHDIVEQIRNRSVVYDEWGVASRSSRGLGISALFSGGSGTGKTMAAEVLARELHMELYRIDISAMVSKYIGETEKNLRRIFDAAESAGVVLLFDEADALFGKRNEVKESTDRFANMEIGYLLQRMEEYSGLAILTTNLKSNVDPAFLRRLRFVVDFSFPSKSERERIWRRSLTGIPTKNLNYERLAELNVAGGDIRNIALNAAFHAAARERPVEPPDILAATRIEFAKLERPLSAGELRGLA